KAFSFEPVIKTPFDLLKHLAVWQLQVSNKKSKGGPNGERKELSAHPMEL
ncbi:transposase, partial [Escherichia coli]